MSETFGNSESYPKEVALSRWNNAIYGESRPVNAHSSRTLGIPEVWKDPFNHFN